MTKESELNETKENQTQIDGIWHTLNMVGIITIILSIVAGIYILSNFNTTITGSGLYISSEPNILGIASGITVSIQGSIIGVFMIGLSKLGESVNRIELYITQSSDKDD